MKTLFAWLKEPKLWTLLGLIALGLIIWVGGPFVRFGENNVAPLTSVTARLIALLVIVSLWGLNNLWQHWAHGKKEKSLLDGLKSGEAESSNDDSAPQTEAELAVLKQRFDDALTTLKKSGAKTPLYDLPWYIIIGPPGSGKTTALLNSGLHFPLAKSTDSAVLGGVGGTRNCDWWFTNEAVLIDTAGRYTTQDSHRVVDSSAWRGFLDLLKRHRKRRPINGAIIAISAQDLLVQVTQDRQRQAAVIRERVDELHEQLGIEFPIYFMITKMDLVAGFNEFFVDMRKEDRAQVWGVTFPLNREASNLEQELGQELDALVERINAQVMERLHREKDLGRRSAIQGFPLQIAQLKTSLAGLVNDAFAENRFARRPLLRGVYFTSATQQGNPIDRVMAAVASKFAIRMPMQTTAVGQGKSFFIEKLLKGIVFAESEIVGVDRKHEKSIKGLRLSAMVGTVIIGLASVGVWWVSYSRYEGLLSQSRALAQLHKDERAILPSLSPDPVKVLAALAPLRDGMSLFQGQTIPWLINLGLYDASVPEAIEEAYRGQLAALFLPRIVLQIEQFISNHLQDLQLQDALKVYLMLGEPARFEEPFVKSWLDKQWARELAGRASELTTMNTHLTVLVQRPLRAGGLNQQVVESGRSALSRMPVAQRIYNSIKGDKQYGQMVDLLPQVGDSANVVFKIDNADRHYQMPYLFTKVGYQSLDLEPGSEVVQRAIADQWVVGQVEGEDLSDKDIEVISDRVKELYLQDYLAHWQTFVAGFKVDRFESWDQTQRKLTMITDPVASPLINLLQLIRENTQLTAVIAEKLKPGKVASAADKLQKLGPESLQPNIVDRAFRDISGLVVVDQSGQTRIVPTVAALMQLKGHLTQMQMSGDAGTASYQFAKARMSGGAADVLGQIRVNALSLPTPVQQWVNRFGEESWLLVLGQAKQHLNKMWEAEVLSVYKTTISQRYPLPGGNRDDLALDDFAQFFGPGGTQESFVKEHLSAFVDPRRGWVARVVDGHGISMRSESLEQLKRAERIRQIFFKGSSPKLDFQMRPERLDATVSRFEMSLGEQNLKYTHGPKIKSPLQWPSMDSSGARITFADLNDSRHQARYEGPWAFFRLLEQSKLRNSARANEYNVTFSADGRQADYTIIASGSQNPFGGNELRQFHCPEVL